MDIWGIWRVVVLIFLSIPLLSATSRRLQDMGEPGNEAIYPFLPFIMLWVGYQAALWLVFGSVSLGLVGIGLFIGWIGLVLFIPLYLVAIFVSLSFAASIIGKMLVSSSPGPNRYGPNPLEVTP